MGLRAAGVFLAALFSITAGAQQAPSVPPKAALCTTCHGAKGIGLLPDTPHLAGQPAIYLSAQLKAFRSGARKHEVMQVIAKDLANDDIAELAAWYAAQQIELKQP